jgi:hypothetical protein
MTNPDPHFRLEVSHGVFTCAVPACTEHKYLSTPIAVPCRFEGGPAHGHFERIIDPPEFVVRDDVAYRAGLYEDGSPSRTGVPVLVYQPEVEWTPETTPFTHATVM